MSEVLADGDQEKLGAGSQGNKKGNQNKHLSETVFTDGHTFLGADVLGQL